MDVGRGIGSGRGSCPRKGIGSGKGNGSNVIDDVGMLSEASVGRGKVPNSSATNSSATTSSSQVKRRKNNGYGCYVNLHKGETIKNVS